MKRALAMFCTAAPFVAASFPALSARHDIRMLWMAIAATLVARLLVAPVSARGLAVAAGVAMGAATIVSAAVALVLGARAPFGIVAVAVVLAAFATAGATLNRFAR